MILLNFFSVQILFMLIHNFAANPKLDVNSSSPVKTLTLPIQFGNLFFFKP